MLSRLKASEQSVVYTRNALDVLFFEDLELGGQWTTRGRTVTDADLAAHAGVSGDFGPLHMDATRAAAGTFSSRVAHGSLLISIAIGLGSMDVPVFDQVGMVGTNWRFLKPVKPGTTVHASWRLGRKREVSNPRWGLTVWQVELHDQNQECVMEGEVTVLVNRRSAAAPAAARSRRRRRGKAVPPAPLPVPSAEANLPEPAPADAPLPAARRRRPPRPAVPVAGVPAQVTEVQPEAQGLAAEVTAPPTASRRRRRRRGGGGGAAAPSGTLAGGTGPPENAPSPAIPVIQEPSAPAPEPPRGTWAAPEAAAPREPADNAVSRVFGRFRRSRARPVAPSPGETRSPSE